MPYGQNVLNIIVH